MAANRASGISVRGLLAGLMAWAIVSSGGRAAEPPANHDQAAQPPVNYDEAAVGTYTLPDVLAGADGTRAASAAAWRDTVRPRQFSLLEANLFGRRLPPVAVTVVGDVERAAVTLAGDRPALRVQARLKLGDAPRPVDVLLYLPRSDRPVPVFLGLNFHGNQAEHPDPGIRLCSSWLADAPRIGIEGNRAGERSRGTCAQRWPVETMLARGYGMATAYYGDLFPDRPDGRAESVLPSLGRPAAGDLPADEPGAIGAWAWGLSRILDWLRTLPEVDRDRVIVVGHSRLGKAALWAGACDERFAMVVSNDSGCAGAALSRRDFGESVAAIGRRFPHWFCPAFAGFAGREAAMPFDQHVLLAMVAPRPLYVASAVEDRWADPRGEFLAAVAAEPVWKLHGLTGLGTDTWPAVDTPVGRTIGYHVRTGRHDLIDYDWGRFADFADRTLLGRPAPPAAYPAFHPVQAPLPVKPPPGAILLLGDGTGPAPDAPAFTSMAGGPIDWPVRDGVLEVKPNGLRSNHLVSRPVFRDADIHVEFAVDPAARGNSGLYLHGHYELQIYDSAGVQSPGDQDQGSLYRFARPIVNAARPAGEWQVFDVRFIAPRRDAAGRIVTPGRVTAWLNGFLVQNGVTFTEPRSPYHPYLHGVTDHLRGIEKRLLETGRGPLFLQDHDSPTRFRNVWILPLDR
jgi:hypothetical protein